MSVTSTCAYKAKILSFFHRSPVDVKVLYCSSIVFCFHFLVFASGLFLYWKTMLGELKLACVRTHHFFFPHSHTCIPADYYYNIIIMPDFYIFQMKKKTIIHIIIFLFKKVTCICSALLYERWNNARQLWICQGFKYAMMKCKNLQEFCYQTRTATQIGQWTWLANSWSEK